MKIRNYTPHTITLAGDTRTVLPSEGVARVDGLPLGPVVGLPDPRPGVLYVVSIIVAERLPHREQPELAWVELMRRAGATTLTVPQCMGGEYGTAVASRDSGDGEHVVIGTVHVETHECPLAPGLLCWITMRDAWRDSGGVVVHPKDPRPLEFIEIPKPSTERN